MQAEQIIKKFDQLKAERYNFESQWQEVCDYILPRKNDIISQSVPGTKKGQALFDSTAIHANELLAGALHGMLTNPSSVWFNLTTGERELDEQDDVRKWLQKTSDKINDVLNDSNFQTEIHEVYTDLGTIGTACMDIMKDDDKIVIFHARHMSEIVVEESNKGIIDSYYRDFKWGARQIVEEFGIENVGQAVTEAYKSNRPELFQIIHAVYPRRLEEGDKEKKGPKYYKFGSKYVLKKDRHELSESGFKTFPAVIPRWTKVTGEVYGRSPGMTCLPDVKMLNKMMETVLKGAQKAVSPPLMVPDDGFINGKIRTTPDAINYYRSGTTDRIESFGHDARIDFGYQAVEDVRKRIRSCYYVDQLQLNDGPQMTATEVVQRNEEKMRMMGPVLGRQQSELLAPMIDRIFDILVEENIIDKKDIPGALRGKNLKVRYSSLVAKAQRTSEAQNISRTIEAIAPFAQTDPSVMDNFDPDAVARFSANIFGLPAEILRTQDEIKGIRQGRQQAQQAAQQQQQQMEQSQQVKNVGPTAIQAKEKGMV